MASQDFNLFFGPGARLHQHGPCYFLSVRYGSQAKDTATYYLSLFLGFKPSSWTFVPTRPTSTFFIEIPESVYQELKKIF